MKDFKFTPKELNFLKSIKTKGSLSNNDASKIESIYQRIDKNYKMCLTCSSVIARETNKLIIIAERFIDGKIIDYDQYSKKNVIFDKRDLQGLTAKNIITVVLELEDIQLKSNPKSKNKVIKEALIILNN